MEPNPYAPPRAAVADIAPVVDTSDPIFFPVSRRKLVVLLILTLTLYQLVWFYKNWAFVRRRGERVLPLLRTIFTVFTCYGLFERVRRRGAPAGVRLPADLLAAAYISLTVVGNVLDRFVTSEESPGVYAISGVLLYAAVFCLVPVQNAINAINRAEVPDHDPNDRFTVLNWVWMVVGGLVQALVLLGLLGSALPVP